VPNSNSALADLQCQNNKLVALDLSACQSLFILSCQNNLLTSLNLSGCTSLNSIRCYENQLTSLDVTNKPQLEKIYCYDNRMATFDISAMPILSAEGYYHVYCGQQTTDGTTSQTLTLTMAAKHKAYWDSNLASTQQNAGVNVVVK
jgi:Leucine-rich repeat (LRR) protein